MIPADYAATILAGREELQAYAESLMIDSVLIERRGTESTIDPETYEEVWPYVTVYAGPCKVRTAGVQAREVSAGETNFDVSAAYIDLPLSDPLSGGVRAGDRATITGAALDASNVGRVYVVQRDVERSAPVERRLFCQEVS